MTYKNTFRRLARRAGCGKVWIIVSGFAVGLLAALPVWEITTEPIRFEFLVPAVWFSSVAQFMDWYLMHPWQTLQLLLPLGVSLLLKVLLDFRHQRLQLCD